MIKCCTNCKNYPSADCYHCSHYSHFAAVKIDTLKGKDVVNSPAHYMRKDALECIDEMLMIFGKQAVMDFCACNAWKYRYRAADKNGSEDIAKSDWYMRKFKELRGDKQ